MARIGCGTHTAVIIDRDTGHTTVQFDRPIRTEWSRVRDTNSTARVQVPTAGCCEQLASVRPWRHELVIYRDGVQVWQGPLTQPVSWSDVATIVADDPWSWLDVRYPREDVEISGDLTSIAQRLIAIGLTHPDGVPDETGVLDHVQVRPAGVWGEREFEAYRSSVGASLRSLCGGGMHATFVGRRLVLAGQQPLGRLPAVLQDQDFVGGVSVTYDGYAAASRVIVLGADGVTAAYGRTDPYYGLIERVISDSTITDHGSALELARIEAGAGMPPPAVVSLGDNAILAEGAPVSIEQLVPGVVVPIWTTETCFTADSDMILDRVRVVEDEQGETVAITVSEHSVWTGETISGTAP